ncbi:MAG: hypothetical protein BWY47_00056 [Bacteroidetes bacterium ADurb.Bin302]|nr:MAG: hypothetical protein BWY47_00056 [Bacteroidetes bacterium ADurb.Bin302]
MPVTNNTIIVYVRGVTDLTGSLEDMFTGDIDNCSPDGGMYPCPNEEFCEASGALYGDIGGIPIAGASVTITPECFGSAMTGITNEYGFVKFECLADYNYCATMSMAGMSHFPLVQWVSTIEACCNNAIDPTTTISFVTKLAKGPVDVYTFNDLTRAGSYNTDLCTAILGHEMRLWVYDNFTTAGQQNPEWKMEKYSTGCPTNIAADATGQPLIQGRQYVLDMIIKSNNSCPMDGFPINDFLSDPIMSCCSHGSTHTGAYTHPSGYVICENDGTPNDWDMIYVRWSFSIPAGMGPDDVISVYWGFYRKPTKYRLAYSSFNSGKGPMNVRNQDGSNPASYNVTGYWNNVLTSGGVCTPSGHAGVGFDQYDKYFTFDTGEANRWFYSCIFITSFLNPNGGAGLVVLMRPNALDAGYRTIFSLAGGVWINNQCYGSRAAYTCIFREDSQLFEAYTFSPVIAVNAGDPRFFGCLSYHVCNSCCYTGQVTAAPSKVQMTCPVKPGG